MFVSVACTVMHALMCQVNCQLRRNIKDFKKPSSEVIRTGQSFPAPRHHGHQQEQQRDNVGREQWQHRVTSHPVHTTTELMMMRGGGVQNVIYKRKSGHTSHSFHWFKEQISSVCKVLSSFTTQPLPEGGFLMTWGSASLEWNELFSTMWPLRGHVSHWQSLICLLMSSECRGPARCQAQAWSSWSSISAQRRHYTTYKLRAYFMASHLIKSFPKLLFVYLQYGVERKSIFFKQRKSFKIITNNWLQHNKEHLDKDDISRRLRGLL